MAIILALSGGCAAPKSEQKDPFFDKWRTKAVTARGYSPSAEKRVLELPETEEEREAAADEADRRLPTQPVTLKMHNIEISVLLRALARAVDQNMMINESVVGRININVEQAPWDQVFLGLLGTYDLSYDWQGDIIKIISLEDKDRGFKQLEIEQKIKAKKREIEIVDPLLTRVIKVDYADAAKLKENLATFLTEKGEGKALGSVLVDEHSNSLIIQAIRRDLVRMVDIIARLDQPTPQILIEAHIVETTRTTARDLGIKWGGLYADIGSGSSYAISSEALNSNPADVTSGTAINFPADLVDNIGLTLGFAASDSDGNLLSVQLAALEQEGKLNILSSPSITTLDNQTALIESGEESPYQTVEDGDVKIEYKKAVLSLEVTPHVIAGKTLKMEIKTTKDELDFTNQVQGNPTVITKRAETKVILFDGQTTVIGGLSKERSDNSESGIPFLKDMPLLGYLFKGTSRDSDMEEVLIFITPHILKARVAD